MDATRVEKVKIAGRQLDAILPNLIFSGIVAKGVRCQIRLNLRRPETIMENHFGAVVAMRSVL